ncbi:MAG TPA: YcaO-like family protein [Acetobacteraceae bacterium]|nr:YcaO-like family protein [Acetobacteraceae bacterium]
MQPHPEPEMQALAATLRAAAAILLGEAAPEGRALDFLLQLDYLREEEAAQAPHRAALLHAAAGFRRIFTLEAEDAPGLVALGAEVDPGVVGGAVAGVAVAGVAGAPLGSVSGTGLTFRQAFEACIGEGVEYLSQFAIDGDPIKQLTADEALGGASPGIGALWEYLQPFRRDPGAMRTGWTVAADLADGSPVRLPADCCFRRPAPRRDIDPPWPLSTGCGAGPDHLTATLHGLFELIERDAVALWWRGGQRARLVPPGVGAAVLAQLRGGAVGRHTWLLDISSDLGVPVVAAASCNTGGFGLCYGHAAGATLAGAADAAVREMAQMELAARLSATKRAVRGEAALNDADRQHLHRFKTVDVAATPALQPMAPPSPPRDLPAHDPFATLAALRQCLAAAGLTACALNLTRAGFGIPVTRVVCPGLEQGVSSPPGSRLSQSMKFAGIATATVAPL